MSNDPRFADRPNGRAVVPDFELKIAETNQFAVRVCGYVHPPVTGDYKFWLERLPADFAAVGYANLLMSQNENPSEVVQSAGGSFCGILKQAVRIPVPKRLSASQVRAWRGNAGQGRGTADEILPGVMRELAHPSPGRNQIKTQMQHIW